MHSVTSFQPHRIYFRKNVNVFAEINSRISANKFVFLQKNAFSYVCGYFRNHFLQSVFSAPILTQFEKNAIMFPS